jgi:hypothetical protein
MEPNAICVLDKQTGTSKFVASEAFGKTEPIEIG